MATSSEPQPAQSAFKMVVIGETGSGKTSFIQLLLNYAKQFGNKEYKLDLITSFVQSESDKQSDKREQWESDTTDSKKYSAQYGDFALDIIDTPGFCDTRGGDQEKINIANIIAIVKKELYINCVCLIINGTQVRMTTVMKDVITQIVSILPHNVLQNVIVVYTKVRDELSLKFDPKLLQTFQLSIPKEYFFIIDNPYSRYESLTAASDTAPNKKQVKKLQRDFVDAHETLDEMFQVVKTLKPEMTLKFGEFREAVNDIETSLVKLKTHHGNKEKVLRLIENAGTYESFVNMVKYEKTLTKDSGSENLICEYCSSNCHMGCDCWFTSMSVWWCNRFKKGRCKKCDHGTKSHKIVKLYFEKVTEVLELPDEDRIAKRKCLDEELAKHEEVIAKETSELETNIIKFQGVGSNFIFSKNAIEQIEHFTKEVESLPHYTFEEKICTMLNETKDVIGDPTTAKNEEIKARWACGVLGLEDPYSLTEQELLKFFKRQAQQVHPSSTSNESTSAQFKHLNYAKDYLKGFLFRKSNK